MVRRIVSDSDFDSDEENNGTEALRIPGNEVAMPADSSFSDEETPRSPRRIVQPQGEDHGTYDYNSDIYTEESSLGSFIVYSDEEAYENESIENSDSDISIWEDLNKLTLKQSKSDSISSIDSPEELLSGALLVHHPERNPRRQLGTLDAPAHPRTFSRFKYPLSPHKDTSPEFWNRKDHFNWIDLNTPIKPPTLTSESKQIEAQRKKARKDFTQRRERLALELMKEIDDKVMEGKLAQSTAMTGGIKLVWCGRLRSAAGNAHWTPTRGIPLHNGVAQHNLRIKLSPSIITNEDKLRNTLAHELCHCACFVIDNDRRSHHGPAFKRWAAKVMTVYPDVLITTTHSYEIDHKYKFVCSNQLCGASFGRQKRIDLTRKVCGRCKSPFLQTKPVPRNPGKENKSNPFGEFVRDRFAEIKKCNPGSPHKEIMGILSRQYHEEKISKGLNTTDETDKGSVEIIDVDDSEDEVEDTLTGFRSLQISIA